MRDDAILLLHGELFGFVPSKAGTAYERVAALVLAALGWQDVTHDVTERPAGRRAYHQLDIVARDPAGQVRRLIVECKDYATTIGERALNTLVGVKTQIGADAAVIVTTQGFTKGARAVAVDEDIAMVILRHYDPQTERLKFVKKVILTFDWYLPTFSDFEVATAPSAEIDGPRELALEGRDRLRHIDGTPAESIAELLERESAGLVEGRFERNVKLNDGRLVYSVANEPIPISGLAWVEEVVKTSSTITREMQGTPVLVIEQIDEDGDVASGRLVVSEDLYAWDIDERGRVHPRGALVTS